jgi:hypothetical protein
MLQKQYGLYAKSEFHSKYFLLNKKPYVTKYNFSVQDRLDIFDLYCNFLASLELKFINVGIVKGNIISPKYKVLDRALTYSIQRIENDLNTSVNPNEKFLVITDEGRVGSMVKTSRRLRAFNHIPSKFSNGTYSKPITSLIEDPLPKNSKESYMIQAVDLVSYICYLYALDKYGIGYGKRLSAIINSQKVTDWMNMLKPSLNTKASSKDPYGVVFSP